MNPTRSLISRVRTRRALVAALEDLQRGAAYGAGAAAACLLAGRLHLVEMNSWWAAAVGGAVAAAVPLLHAVTRRHDDAALAALADERLGLRERLSTSLWWERTKLPETADFGPLVTQDAEAAAARIPREAVTRAFRPRLLRRPLVAAGVLVAAGAALVLFAGSPAEAIVETETEKVARLADANRLAEVARKIQEAAKRVEEAAAQKKETELAKVAAEVRRQSEPLTRAPSPPREEALRKLNELADLAKEQARRSAGMRESVDPQELQQSDKELDDLLRDLQKAGLGSLEKDLSDLEKRLASGEKGEKGPTSDEIRKLANRLDALRKAMERAASDPGSKDLAKKLRAIGNEKLLAKIAERMRQIAARLDRGEGYSDLQQESDAESLDLSQMTEEELQKLLDDLDQLAGMKDLEEMLRKAGAEMRGGPKLRLEGVGGT